MDAAIAAAANDKKWIGAKYEGIKIVSNTAVGKVGQTFVESLCAVIGLTFTVPVDANGRRLNQSPWDIKILGKEFELKTATEDVSRCFQFNHIRYHRPYDGETHHIAVGKHEDGWRLTFRTGQPAMIAERVQ